MKPPDEAILPGHIRLSEPALSFHPDRLEDQHVHPLVGLQQFGPYSRALVGSVTDPIRVATIVPEGMEERIRSLLAELEEHHQPRERREYLVDFLGFSRTFGVRLLAGPAAVHLTVPRSFDQEVTSAERPHLLLAEKLTKAIAVIERQRTEFDVLLILLPQRWEVGFYGGPDDDFDLHDYLKAITAARAVPTQVVREASAMGYFCRCSVMWRLGIALYCKAGGVPWKLARPTEGRAFIGLSYALRFEGDEPRFVTCCSQVFDADGSGLEFIAFDTQDIKIVRHNPFLGRDAMRRVLSRSLSLYQRRHAGCRPARAVVHKSTPFRPSEVDGCFDAWGETEGLELLQVQQDVAWRGISFSGKNNPTPYPCERGSALQLDGVEVLLWTQGNAPDAAGGKNFFKEGKGTPHPILLRRFAGQGSLVEACAEVLGLTKMNWNNDSLYDRLPVTMGFAQTLARTVKRMPALGPTPYQFRFFM